MIDHQVVPGRKLTFLGSGTSTGVPMIGCDCAVCASSDPRNQRMRPSVLLELPGGNLLIDTSPEMRLQLLRAKVKQVHAIAYTHAHVDHLFGLDDSRLFSKALNGPVPVYCEEHTVETIERVFSYAFRPGTEKWPPGSVPKLDFHRLAPGAEFEVLGQKVMPIRLEHGPHKVLGFRIGGLAYCTDVSRIPDESKPLLEGLDVLVLDALRFDPHPTHFCLSQALEAIESIRPGRAFLTHLSHSFDHGPTEASLPAGVFLAYDGLTLEF